MDQHTHPLELDNPGSTKQMQRAMRISLVVGFFMLAVKLYAFAITGSVAILSDAAESVVHVLAVSFAAYSLRLSLKPADRSHLYGHDRISFFSAGFEGAMIILAAFYIIYEAIHKWLHGLAIENIDTGTLFTVLATVVNGLLGWYLVRLGRKHRSIVLEANGKHVLTDSWTSLGVIVGLILTMITGWLPFDPILAIIVALNILWTGGRLIRQSIGGLMDEADPLTHQALVDILSTATQRHGIEFHDLRHRYSGTRHFIEFHLIFPDSVSLARAHEEATLVEQEIHSAFPGEVNILTHLEPRESHDEIHERILKRPPAPG